MCDFTARKWTLFSLCLFSIIVTIVVTIMDINLVDESDRPSDVEPYEWPGFKVLL